MLISNIFSRKVYPITVICLMIFEFIFMVIICIFFYVSLRHNRDYLDDTILENIKEIQNSFNSFLTRKISSAKQDLFLIGKHSNIFLEKMKMKIQKESNFYKSLKSCMIESSKVRETFSENYKNILDNEDSMISYTSQYLRNQNNNSEEMINYYRNDTFLDKISWFGGINILQDKIDNYETYICYMKTIFKSIFIKESVTKGKFMSLNKIYLFMNEFIFQYLPKEINLKTLQELSIYSNKVSCQYNYYSFCVSDFFKKNMNYSTNKNFTSIDYVQYFHYFDKKYNFYSCLNLTNFSLVINEEKIDMKNNTVCVVHNMKYLLETQFNFQNLTTMEIKNNVTDLLSVKFENNKLLLIYSLRNNVKEFYNIYSYYFSAYNDLLKDYSFSEETQEIELFHLIYFEIFKYKKSELTETIINELILEYENIKAEIIKGIAEIESSNHTINNTIIFEKIIKFSQHFLFSSYNISGLIDHEKGKIKKGDFKYLITPLVDKNIYYYANNYTKVNFSSYNSQYSDTDVKILGYNIIIYQNTLDIWNWDIFIIMILKMSKWFLYFVVIIVFMTTLINVLFTKILDKIFNPISLLYSRLSAKLMSTKLVLEENNLSVKQNNLNNNNNEEQNNDLTSEIISSTPEMEELIQLCKFLENITYMKELMSSNEQMELDFDLMNEMYDDLSNRIDMIKYGHFVSSFYFKKKKYIECLNSIKIIENLLESEQDRLKEENENIEIEMINGLSGIRHYINEFQSSREIFENRTSLSQLNYYELIIIKEKLYFYLGICNLLQIVELKNKVKELKQDYELQNKKNYYSSLRGRALTNKRFQTKSNENGIGNNNQIGRESINIKLNSQVKAMEILENQIIQKTELAIKYFKLSYEINNKYGINKIKCIVILLYIAKCQLNKEQNKSEAIDTIKTAINQLYNLNKYFRRVTTCKFNPIIMLLINGAIMEQILYVIVKININTNNKLTLELLSDIMKLSYFKTDNIQSKTAKSIANLIKKASLNLKSLNKKEKKVKISSRKISFFKKLSFRLSPNFISIQNNNPDIIKNIFILFSPNLIKVLPSSIELGEIISKCVRNYMSANDRIQCLRFDMDYNPDNFRTPSELNKDFIIRLLQNYDKIKNYKQGMKSCISSIVRNFSSTDEENDDNFNDKDIIVNDNYIFQFILSKDYNLDLSNKNFRKIKDEIKRNNISLYTFVFDNELKQKDSEGHSKVNDIMKNYKKIPEGVLIFVDNFLNIKMAFQNISRKYKPKNIFRINSESYNNIFIDNH